MSDSAKDKFLNFKKELADLFEKYKADISFDTSYGSDLHGVYDPKMVVNFQQNNDYDRSFTLSDGYSVNRFDLI